jgi:hypothetical protein
MDGRDVPEQESSKPTEREPHYHLTVGPHEHVVERSEVEGEAWAAKPTMAVSFAWCCHVSSTAAAPDDDEL